MGFGPMARVSLDLVDVSAPGAPILVAGPTQNPITGQIRMTWRLPTTDANGGELTGLTQFAIVSDTVGLFHDSMEENLADSTLSQQVIDVSANDPGSDIEVEFAPLGTSGTQYFAAACSDNAS